MNTIQKTKEKMNRISCYSDFESDLIPVPELFNTIGGFEWTGEMNDMPDDPELEPVVAMVKAPDSGKGRQIIFSD